MKRLRLACLLPLAALAACAGAPTPPPPDRSGPGRPAPGVTPGGPGAAPGRLAEQSDDPAEAEAAHARRLAVADDPEARLGRALALERLGRDAEAIAELERLRATEPISSAARVLLAERYEAAGRLTEAEAELRLVAEASTGRPEGWRRLAAFCARQDFTERARAAEARARQAESRPKRELRPLLPAGR